MFSKSIVLSDAFLDMPPTARCLYFTLSMLADDDGFVYAPKAIMRQSGATEDDMKMLIAKYFLIPFESGVVVIRQWRINNYLRWDRYTETKCLEEKAQLKLEPDGSYSVVGKQQRTVRVKAKTVPLLNREPKNPIEAVEKEYLSNYKELYEQGLLKSETPIINWGASRKLTKETIEKHGLDMVLDAIMKSKDSQFCIEKGYVLTTILSAGVFAGLVNGGQKKGVVNESVGAEDIDF